MKNKVIIGIVGVVLVALVGSKVFAKKQQPTIQTATVQKGTFIRSVGASGSITTGTNLTITTQVSGLVDMVYVKNGDLVTKGQKIAKITPDQESLQHQTAALASYLSAKNQLESAKAKINSLQASAFKANQTFINDAATRNLATSDPTYIQEYATWLQAESDYKNQSEVIAQTGVSVTSAWLSYQLLSSIITAPMSGIIHNLTIAPGVVMALPKVGTIQAPDGHTQAIVNLSEVDMMSVHAGQKVTLTLDALPDKTFTGSVLIIDTNGQVSSGVTTYPATIVFDTSAQNIYANMGVSVKIITDVKNDVLLVPSAAIQTDSNGSTVKIMKNNQPQSVSVQVGESNDTETEIVAGISEGDEVVTGTSTTTNRTQSTGTSPFNTLGGNRRFGR